MSIYEYILDNYSPLEPISFHELLENGLFKNTLAMQLKKLVEEKKIVKFSRGIYFLPKRNEKLGLDLTITNASVAKKKYIEDNGEVFGFYSEHALLNMYKFTTQVPNVITIVTNKETMIKREVKINDSKYILKKSRTTITKDNVSEMQFLELINFLDNDDYEMDKEENFNRLKTFVKEKKVDFKKCRNLLCIYPAKVSKRYVEVENVIM